MYVLCVCIKIGFSVSSKLWFNFVWSKTADCYQSITTCILAEKGLIQIRAFGTLISKLIVRLNTGHVIAVLKITDSR